MCLYPPIDDAIQDSVGAMSSQLITPNLPQNPPLMMPGSVGQSVIIPTNSGIAMNLDNKIQVPADEQQQLSHQLMNHQMQQQFGGFGMSGVAQVVDNK